MENATTKHLLELAAAFGAHMNLSHWRVSYLARRNGQFFKNLEDGKSCTLKTATLVMTWFDATVARQQSWQVKLSKLAATRFSVPGSSADHWR